LSFKAKMMKVSKSNHSPLVLALDFPFEKKENRQNLLPKALNVLEAVHPYICAVKINHHLVLPLGLFDEIQGLVEQIHKRGLLAIMDAKVNDIGATNQTIAQYYFEAGFDAIIANPFVGWEEGLKSVFEVAKTQNRGVILLGYMSHRGAAEGFGQTVVDTQVDAKTPQYISFAQKALVWGADGMVVGATVPQKIKEISEVLGSQVPIYSPGVGAQGGGAMAALNSGASYLIVGREITLAENPAKAATNLLASIEHC
jgi:orotidine-5'-phosphate decarboxylase